MSQQSPAAVTGHYFAALGRGDFPEALGLFSPDVVWHQPGANRFSRQHVGPSGIGDLLGKMMEASGGTFELTVTGPLMVNGDDVAVPVRFKGQRPGASMDMGGIDLLTVSGGRITAVRLFSEDSPSEDEFWGKP